MEDFIQGYDTAIRWVQHTPVGKLKALESEQIDKLRQQLIKEVREAGRALEWVDGIMRIKQSEETPFEE